MSFQVIKHYNTYDLDDVMDTNDIRCESLLSNPEFVMFCIEEDHDDNDSLEDLITQFETI